MLVLYQNNVAVIMSRCMSETFYDMSDYHLFVKQLHRIIYYEKVDRQETSKLQFI